MQPDDIFAGIVMLIFLLFFGWVMWLGAFSKDKSKPAKRRSSSGSSWPGDNSGTSDGGCDGGD